ncbi:MAG TPA: sugar ABC transporter permease [Anaerolineae bacterium]|nr:sugar ABC transporter permease [Anaerolineae bacterium]
MSTAKVSTVRPLTFTQPKGKTSAFARQQRNWGLFFLLPWIIGFFLFQIGPILFTIFLSFTDYHGTSEFKLGNFNFVGLENYQKLFTDPQALPSMGVTLKFALIGIPLGLIVPLLFALLVNSKRLIGSSIFRTLFFLPTVIPVVAGTIIYSGVLNAQSGWINLGLKALGVADPPRWFTDPFWAGFALNLLAVWSVGNAMIILLAGLQGIPTELYEAATVDGANSIQRFFYITIPMLSPVIFYNITLGVILAFQYFVPALLIGTEVGNPQGSLLFFPLHFYRQAFVFSDFGYGSVLALVIFVITMIATGLLFFFGQRLVYYASAER